MPYIYRILIVLLVSAGFSACATLNESECLTADWYAIGHEDASYGRDLGYLSNHRKACAKHGVTPNFDRYKSGHYQGLSVFCKDNRGFSIGSSGGAYPNVCDRQRFPGFLTAYDKGRDVFAVRQRVNAAQADLNAAIAELDAVIAEMQANEEAIIADETFPEERRELLERNRSLEPLIPEIEAEIRQLETVVRERERELEYVRSRQ